MSDPFEVLGVSPTADEAELRRRYLELVRQSPPDRDPERFARVREAYDQVRDPARRLEKQMFQVATNDSIDALIADLRGRLAGKGARISLDALLRLAETS